MQTPDHKMEPQLTAAPSGPVTASSMASAHVSAKEWHTPALTIMSANSAKFSVFPGGDFTGSS